jgi:hypothetical protein
MFTEIWKKYLPVIVILLKRSAKGEQMLNLDQADFKRAAGGRKIKFSFDTLRLNDGRTEYNANLTPMAMNSDFQLIIKNNTIPADAVPE